MPRIPSGNVELEYEEFGSPGDPPMVLIMGLGMQMIMWPEPFCAALADSGFRVIRFDNRDAGLSTKLAHLPAPNPVRLGLRQLLGRRVRSPYLLDDLAADTVALLDGLGIAAAHVVGVSMGGMIAQLLAIDWPERVRSLVSIMSTTGARDLPGPRVRIVRQVIRRPRRGGRDALLDHLVRTFRMIGSPAYPTPPEVLRERLGRALDRSVYPEGFARQLAAILASGSRRAALAQVRVPTLVVHGDADPLVPLACGLDTARNVPDARMEVIPGMGHDLPDALLVRLAGRIAAHARDAEAPQAGLSVTAPSEAEPTSRAYFASRPRSA